MQFELKYSLTLSLIILIFVPAFSQDPLQKPDTVTFQSGSLQLKGLLWKPFGKGPFPAIMYNHGSEARPERFLTKTPYVFLEHGYAFFAPFRRGQGFSKGQGKYIIEQLDSASKAGGQSARFALVIKLHETSQLQDQLAALTFLKSQPGIDANRIALVGISFGGIQTMLMAQHDGIKAALNFAGAAMMWEKSPEVAAWMQQGVSRIKTPVYFIQAENDFSIKPSLVLSEEMKKLGRPYVLKIYPPRGTTPMEGHTLIDADEIWAPDVFPQLDKWMNKK
jgi:carboxymethylenebutenolidase